MVQYSVCLGVNRNTILPKGIRKQIPKAMVFESENHRVYLWNHANIKDQINILSEDEYYYLFWDGQLAEKHGKLELPEFQIDIISEIEVRQL